MRFTIFVITICLFAVGCNSDPRCRRETALLRSEILDLEDKYYLLKGERDSALSQLSGYQGGSGQIVSEPYYSEGEYLDGGMISEGEIIYEGAPIVDGNIIYDQPMISDGASMVPGSIEQNIPTSNSMEPVSVQNLDSFPEQGSGGEATNGMEAFDDFDDEDYPDLTLNSPNLSAGYQRNPSNSISEVLINLEATRGRDVDGRPGDEGLDMLIQTRSPGGKIELQTGELTVSIVDPAQPAAQQRIGLWKFVDEEVELFFANDEIGSHGILLHLPWEQATPIRSRLIAHVRFVTLDGKTLKTSSEIRIKPPTSDYSPDDPLVSGWTQRDSRWIRDSYSQSDWKQNRRPRTGRQKSQANQRYESASTTKAPQTRKLIPAKPVSVKVPGWRPVR